MYLVTGTSSGIGLEIAKYLLSIGKTVVGVSRRATPIEHENFSLIQGDVVDGPTQDKITEYFKGKKLLGVVFNHGVLQPVAPLAKANIAEWKKSFDINFFSLVGLTEKLLPILRENKSNVVMVSSGASTHAYQGWGCYGATKAAMNHFALTLGTEEKDITVLAVAPGVVDTPMQVNIRENFSKHMDSEEAKAFHALKKDRQLVSPEDSGILYGNLAVDLPKELSGQYLRYNDDVLKPFATSKK